PFFYQANMKKTRLTVIGEDPQYPAEIDGPTNVVTNQVTEDTASVSWDPVRADIDKYMVRYISPDGETKEKAVPKDQSSTVLTGLKPGEAYKVFVWAERGNQGSKKADTKALT
ncbi:hypothetical protein A6R68_10596, partial [Neotoma lepida]